MKELRENKRVDTDLIGLEGGLSLGVQQESSPFRIVDVSFDGIGIETAQSFEISEKVFFDINKYVHGFSYGGIVRWVKKGENNTFRMGLEIDPHVLMEHLYHRITEK